MFQEALHLNWQLFEVVNQPAGHDKPLDALMVFGANDALFVLPLLLLALWFGLARWSPLTRQVSGTAGERRMRELGQHLSLLAFVGVGLALVLNMALGDVVYEPRPFVSHPGIVHQLVSHAADKSFPSDHATVATAVAMMLVVYALVLVFRRSGPALGSQLRLAVPLAVAAVLLVVYIGVARVYVGVHYPGDIAGGFICGLAGSLAAVALRPVAEPVLAPLVRVAERLRLA